MHRTQIFVELMLVGVLLSRHAFGQQQCYYPQGNVIDTYSACNASLGGGSSCCSPTDLCTDTGYCIGHAGLWYRGGCTDRTFKAAACAKYCLNVASNSYSNLIYCGAGPDGSALWCCSGGYCCGDSKNTFTPASDTWGNYWYWADSSDSTSPTITSSWVTSSSTSANSASRTNAVSPHSTSASQPTPTAKPSNLPTAIGAGVGVPLGVLAIGIIAFLFWRERRKSGKLQKEWRAEMERTNGSQCMADAKFGSPGASYSPQPSADGRVNPLWHELSGPPPPRELKARPHGT